MSQTPPFTTPLEPGQLFGAYKIQRLLGRGSVAEVYHAAAPHIDHAVALKVLHPHHSNTADLTARQERFLTAMAEIAALHHPNIARVYDYGVEDDAYFIAMALLHGPTLRDRLSERRSGLPFDHALALFRDIAGAVAYAHDHGVIHQDIRPGNIIVTEDVGPVLLDFGLMRVLSDDEMTTARFSPRAPIYSSPEIAAGQTTTPQSDVYSLGILLYELLTGDVPFRDGSAARILVKHLQETPRPPSAVNVSLGPQVDAVILQALAKAPADRFPTPRELLQALEPAPQDDDHFDTITLTKDDADDFRRRLQDRRDAPERIGESDAAGGGLPWLWIGVGAAVVIAIVVVVILVAGGG